MSAQSKRSTLGVSKSLADEEGPTLNRPRIVRGHPGVTHAWLWPGHGRPGIDTRRGQLIQRVSHDLDFVIACAACLPARINWGEVPLGWEWPAPEFCTGPDGCVYAVAQRAGYWVVLRCAGSGGEVLAKRTVTGPRLFPFSDEAKMSANEAALGRRMRWLSLAEVA